MTTVTIIDLISRFFLSFSHQTMILPLTILGYTFYDRRKWGTAIYLLLFNMIFSKFLKNIWQIPLPETLGIVEYAFPSGHMQGTCAFYGWIMLQCKNMRVSIICIIIMLGVAFGLIHFGYHVPRDIFGGLGFAILSIFAYSYLLSNFFVDKEERTGLLLAIIGAILTYNLPNKNFLWLPEGSLVGFTLGWIIAKKAPMAVGLWNKLATMILSIMGAIIIKLGSELVLSPSLINTFISYLLLGFWISITPWVINKYNTKFLH